ncbi:MAG: hypothetical protein QW491_13110 [Thermoproteota archaeon]|nr:hypothetical protein [Candidatus Brockarchaeota archaeon]
MEEKDLGLTITELQKKERQIREEYARSIAAKDPRSLKHLVKEEISLGDEFFKTIRK